MKRLIRRAVAADFPTLLAIDQSCFPPGVAYDRWELRYFMSQAGATNLVAEVEDQTVGFLVLDSEPEGRRATLVTLDVVEAHRNTGIGSLLLDRSEELLRKQEISRYRLQVDISNEGAIAFYQKHGFRTHQTLSGYYSNGADAYLMEKEIVSSQ